MIRSKNILRTALAAFVASISMTSCVNQDIMLGNTLIPPGQQMLTAIDSSLQFKTYTITADSIVASNIYGSLLLGRHIDPITGQLISSGFANFMPGGFPDDTYFGKGARIDSLTLLMNMIYEKGDTLSGPASVEVYEVTKYNFKSDSSYYSNFDITPYINPIPLVVAPVKGAGGDVLVRMPMEYAERFLDNTPGEGNIYNEDTTFHKRFNGLYFKLVPAANSTEGVMYSMSLLTSTSRMFLSYTNDVYPDSSLVQRMFFMSPDAQYEGFNTSLNMSTWDFSKADVSKGGIDYRTVNDTINPQAKTYIASPAGLSGRYELVTSVVDSLKAVAKAQGFKNFAVHRAELVLSKTNTTWQSYDKDIQALALYYDYQTPSFIPDYNYFIEQTSNGSIPTTIGGLLNRVKGQYSLNITRYVQAYLSGRTDKIKLSLGPQIPERFRYNKTVVWGSQAEVNDLKPRLILVYTMVD